MFTLLVPVIIFGINRKRLSFTLRCWRFNKIYTNEHNGQIRLRYQVKSTEVKKKLLSLIGIVSHSLGCLLCHYIFNCVLKENVVCSYIVRVFLRQLGISLVYWLHLFKTH